MFSYKFYYILVGKSNVVNNIYSPGHKTAFADSLAVILYRFRDRDTALSYNYLQKVEYAALHENYQVTDDRVFEGQIGVYGHQIYVRNLQPHTLYSLRTVVYRVWGYEQELVGYSAPVTLKTQCSGKNIHNLTLYYLFSLLPDWYVDNVNVTISELVLLFDKHDTISVDVRR